jgi:hypothetical protein
MEHNSSIFGQVSSQAPLPNHCQPPAFAAMLERQSSFCREMMRWPYLRNGIVVGVAVFFALYLSPFKALIDQTEFQPQFLTFQIFCLLTGPNHNSRISTAALPTFYFVQFLVFGGQVAEAFATLLGVVQGVLWHESVDPWEKGTWFMNLGILSSPVPPAEFSEALLDSSTAMSILSTDVCVHLKGAASSC